MEGMQDRYSVPPLEEVFVDPPSGPACFIFAPDAQRAHISSVRSPAPLVAGSSSRPAVLHGGLPAHIGLGTLVAHGSALHDPLFHGDARPPRIASGRHGSAGRPVAFSA